MNKYLKVSIALLSIAIIQAIAGLLYWGETDYSSTTNIIIGSIEMCILFALLYNSFRIKKQSTFSLQPFENNIAWLCILSLSLCMIGDWINKNFPYQFYQFGEVVKHDYLIDSIIPFGFGYLVLIYAVFLVARKNRINILFVVLTLGIGLIVSAFSYSDLYIEGTENYVIYATGIYSLIIGLVGVSGLWLLQAYRWSKAPKYIWLVSFGLFLAPLADFVIGKYWIFGNNGEGIYPTIRNINWIIYIGSQALVQHLPLSIQKNNTSLHKNYLQ